MPRLLVSDLRVIRRRGSDRHNAEDLTQSFFACLLEKEMLKKVDRQKGRFRSIPAGRLDEFSGQRMGQATRREARRPAADRFLG